MQFEGETNRRGKGPNIWDTFIEEHPGISLFNAGVLYNAFLTKTTNINLSRSHLPAC
jgi:beta-glucosidase/6-phospho-beta-glucosidase/beta-galactosidase